MSAPLVTLTHVRKEFPRVARRRDRARALWRLLLGRQPADPVVVLDDITLEVRRGESLGIVGQNGAGKSTLLKVLTGVLAPTTGTVAVNGSIAALLELGAGFHPEFSGRDNIAMAGALMGFSAQELRDKEQDILAFADIGRYIDEPVKHYSSGMVVRLGFALVAARRPDLLITDEVLAVGDEAFQRKCIRWIEDFLAQGGTLLLVSHSMYHVQKLCGRACWIHGGRVRALGESHQVTQDYLAWQETRIAAEGEHARAAGVAQEFHVAEVTVNGSAAESPPQSIEQGGDLAVTLTLRTRTDRVPVAGVGIVRADGTPVYGVSSEMDGGRAVAAGEGLWRYSVDFPALTLLPGTYFVRAHAMDTEALRVFDTLERAFVVRGKSMELGLVRLGHRWHGADDGSR